MAMGEIPTAGERGGKKRDGVLPMSRRRGGKKEKRGGKGSSQFKKTARLLFVDTPGKIGGRKGPDRSVLSRKEENGVLVSSRQGPGKKGRSYTLKTPNNRNTEKERAADRAISKFSSVKKKKEERGEKNLTFLLFIARKKRDSSSPPPAGEEKKKRRKTLRNTILKIAPAAEGRKDTSTP